MKIIVCCIVGLIAGALVDEGRGVVWGLFAGGVFGLLWSQMGGSRSRAVTDVEARIEHIYRALGDIHLRLTALEAGTVRASAMVAPAAPQTAPPRPAAAPVVPPATSAPSAQAPAAAVPTRTVVPEQARPMAAAARAAAPPESPGNPLFAFIRDWFTGGNTVVRVGIIVLIFGVGFLLKYAAEHTHVPIEVRLIGVALGAVVLLVLGWRLRERRTGFAVALQGGGVGILYLIVIASMRLYHVLPPTGAFALLVAIVVFSAALAVLQDALALAALGIAGGFLAPILTATESGNHVALFSYYTLLNAGILGIAWFRAWRGLNLLGFALTAVVGTLWATQGYRAELFASTEPFVVLFFVFYVAIAVLYARRQSLEMKNLVDATLLFGTPLVAFGWQAGLLREDRFSLALSALAVAAVYMVLARVMFARRREELRLLIESMLALGVVFATVAIPLALDARWTSAAWALEGAAIVWIGLRQQRLLARAFGMLLQLIAGAAFGSVAAWGKAPLAVFNAFYLGTLFLSLGGLIIAWLQHVHRDRLREGESVAGYLLFAWGLAWWLVGGVHEIMVYLRPDYDTGALAVFLCGSALVLSLWSRGTWPVAQWPAYALPGVLTVVTLIAATFVRHPAGDAGWIAWPLSIATVYVLLRRAAPPNRVLLGLNHCLAFWLAIGLLTWECAWQVGRIVPTGVWFEVAWAIVPSVALIALCNAGVRVRWPFAEHRATYSGYVPALIALFLLLWVLHANVTLDGDAAPLPYLPLINPLDLAVALALIAAVTWLRGLDRSLATPETVRSAYIPLAAVTFIWLTAVLLRSMHHWALVPYQFDALMHSTAVQAALSLFWSLLALLVMVYAVRTVRRALWITGAALLAVVVTKLFLVDLSHVGGIARIVSFIGVGVLLLVIGYFAPVPPRAARQEAAA